MRESYVTLLIQAILIGERASLIEFPALLLPQGVTLGSVVDIRVTRNDGEEQKHREEFVALQDDILQMYGINSPARTSSFSRSPCAPPAPCHADHGDARVGSAAACERRLTLV